MVSLMNNLLSQCWSMCLCLGKPVPNIHFAALLEPKAGTLRSQQTNKPRCDEGPVATARVSPPYVSTVCLLVGCLTSQQHASVSQGRICSDNFTCCHTEIGVADQTFYLTQSQYTDTGPTSPSADPITPGAWQGSHWSANF